jgi:hypothetical protein
MPRKPDLVSTTLTACSLSLLLSSTCLAATVNVRVPAVHVKIPSVVVKPTTNRSVVFRNNTNILLKGKNSGSTSSPGVAVYDAKAGNSSSSPGVAVYGVKAGSSPAGPIAGVPIVISKYQPNLGNAGQLVIAGIGILQAGSAERVPFWLIRNWSSSNLALNSPSVPGPVEYFDMPGWDWVALAASPGAYLRGRGMSSSFGPFGSGNGGSGGSGGGSGGKGSGGGGAGGSGGAPKEGGSLTVEQAKVISGGSQPSNGTPAAPTNNTPSGSGGGGSGGPPDSGGQKIDTVEQAQQASGGGSTATPDAGTTPAAKDGGTGE